MIKLLKKFTAWLDGMTPKDLTDEAALKEKDMLIALKDAEIKELRAENRRLKNIKKNKAGENVG